MSLPLEVIPTKIDVLFGRDKQCFNHTGNMAFRQVVNQHSQDYEQAPCRRDKSCIVYAVFDTVRRYGGRFLKRKGDAWVEVSDTEATQKVGHALRDKKQQEVQKARARKKIAFKSKGANKLLVHPQQRPAMEQQLQYQTQASVLPVKKIQQLDKKNGETTDVTAALLQLGEVCSKEMQAIEKTSSGTETDDSEEEFSPPRKKKAEKSAPTKKAPAKRSAKPAPFDPVQLAALSQAQASLPSANPALVAMLTGAAPPPHPSIAPDYMSNLSHLPSDVVALATQQMFARKQQILAAAQQRGLSVAQSVAAADLVKTAQEQEAAAQQELLAVAAAQRYQAAHLPAAAVAEAAKASVDNESPGRARGFGSVLGHGLSSRAHSNAAAILQQEQHSLAGPPRLFEAVAVEGDGATRGVEAGTDVETESIPQGSWVFFPEAVPNIRLRGTDKKKLKLNPIDEHKPAPPPPVAVAGLDPRNLKVTPV